MDSGRRRRLLTRLHLARAPLPLPLLRRSDSLSLRLVRPAVRPSCLLRWSFFVGVKECAGSPVTGARDRAGAQE